MIFIVIVVLASLPIEANEGKEERLNVSLPRNEGRAVPCSTEVKEGWGEGLLFPSVRSPHHLLSKGREEALCRARHDINHVRRLTYAEVYVLRVACTSAIKRDEELRATAFHLERYLGIVTEYERTHVKTVRSNGRERYRR